MKARTTIDQKEVTAIIGRCQWCHVAMADEEGKPYVIPMNFGFCNDIIYIHGAREGKKVNILRKNPHVCINFSTDHVLRYQNEQVACSWSMKYRSVLCYGKVEFLEDPNEKIAAMNLVMSKYAGREYQFNPPSIREINVMQIKVERYESRIYGY